MKKDAYYFSHFSNARHDRKIKRLRKELGIEGYGIYFMLLEVLREQFEFKYPLEDIDLLSEEFGTSEAKLKTVIANYGLFEIIEGNFTSLKFIFHLTPYIEKSQRARDAAVIRWNKVNANACANALQMKCESECKESIVKESKVEETIQLELIESDIQKVEILSILSFDEFWNLYDKKVGDKTKLQKYWDSIKEAERHKIKEHIPMYIMSRPDKKFRKDPQTYLNNKSWNDEIILESETIKPIQELPTIKRKYL